MKSYTISTIFVVSVALIVFLGCARSPATGSVTGTIKLDSQPLTGTTIGFFPRDGSRPSFGLTNDKGEYELRFTPTDKGAVPGEHDVKILKHGFDPDPVTMPPEPVPTKYNTKTELVKNVQAGKNVIDFDLLSK